MNTQTHYLLRFGAGIVLFAAIAVPLASAAPIQIVVPDHLEAVEGETSADVSNFGSFRQQRLYLATEFASLPESSHTITGFRIRADYTVTTPNAVTYDDLTIRAWTTSAGALTSVFTDNYGADVTTVYEGPLAISTQATGPLSGPRDFDDYYYPFSTPFTYDPNAGNLVVEMSSVSGPIGSLIVDGYFGTPGMYVGAAGANATSGYVQSRGPVDQLEFIPEPATCLLAALAAAGFAWGHLRKG